MKNESTGFVFGNDSNQYDVYLYGDKHISAQLFAMIVNPETESLLLKNLGRHGIHVSSRSLGNLRLTSQRALLKENSVNIFLPDFELYIKVASYRDHVELHSIYQAEFCTRLAQSMPGFAGLNVFSHQSSSRRHTSDTHIHEGEMAWGVAPMARFIARDTIKVGTFLLSKSSITKSRSR